MVKFIRMFHVLLFQHYVSYCDIMVSLANVDKFFSDEISKQALFKATNELYIF